MLIIIKEEDFITENLGNLLCKLDELTDSQLDILDSVLYAVKVDREYREQPKYLMSATMRKLSCD